MIETWYVSTPAFTVALDFEDGLLVYGPPICRWAKGKSREWLKGYWDRKFRDVRWVVL